MFSELLASRPRRQRTLGGTIASVSGHAVLILLAVVASGRTRELSAPRDPPPDVIYSALPDDSRESRSSPSGPRRPTGETGAPSLPPRPEPWRVEIPTGLPAIDSGGPVVDASSFDAASGRSGDPDVVPVGASGTGGVYLATAVERPAMLAPGSAPPRYPESLRRAGIGGRVLARFVVDTLGRAEMGTLRMIDSDHPLFDAAVRTALPAYRFLPAETGGRKVRMWVEMPFVFEMERDR
jgi:protein TonB